MLFYAPVSIQIHGLVEGHVLWRLRALRENLKRDVVALPKPQSSPVQFSTPPIIAAPPHPPPTTQLAWIIAIKHFTARQLIDTKLQQALATLLRPLWPRSVERRIHPSHRIASHRPLEIWSPAWLPRPWISISPPAQMALRRSTSRAIWLPARPCPISATSSPVFAQQKCVCLEPRKNCRYRTELQKLTWWNL